MGLLHVGVVPNSLQDIGRASDGAERRPVAGGLGYTPADYSQLKVFGCTAYAHVDNGKLEPRAVKCLFLGYSSGVKGYKL